MLMIMQIHATQTGVKQLLACLKSAKSSVPSTGKLRNALAASNLSLTPQSIGEGDNMTSSMIRSY